MQSLSWVTLSLCCVWAATLLYGEMLAFHLPLSSCSWPSGTGESAEDRANIAVLADPQLMDKTSLGLPPKSFALEAAQFYTDLYMRRAFLASILPFKPDYILFLGDQFDGGPFLSEDEWQDSLHRFKHIFDQSGREKHPKVEVFYLSGNHDIGYAGFHSLHSKANCLLFNSYIWSRRQDLYQTVINRYEEEFGKRNYRFTVKGVDFVVVDAQTLDGNKHGDLTLESWEFIHNISKENNSNPKVLLTHIPLYRPNDTPCGQHRASPIVNQRISYQGVDQGVSYQNYLSEETSKRLLDLIKPVLVLSGHDHDQCTVIHITAKESVTEHTVGTVSWQQGNLYPSFMLLSVVPAGSANSSNKEHGVYTHLCFLPMQTHIYIWYAILFIVTLFLLASWPTNGLNCWAPCAHLISIMKDAITSSFSTIKVKDDDEDGEYEMVWDAEGTMHLVRKATTIIPHSTSNDMGLTGRGNVVARPQARKLLAQGAADNSVTVEVTADDGGRARPNRSVALRVIQRVIRVIRLVSIIAAVNLPLYMMLIFKDWIDR